MRLTEVIFSKSKTLSMSFSHVQPWREIWQREAGGFALVISTSGFIHFSISIRWVQMPAWRRKILMLSGRLVFVKSFLWEFSGDKYPVPFSFFSVFNSIFFELFVFLNLTLGRTSKLTSPLSYKGGGEGVDGTPPQGFRSIKAQQNYFVLSRKPLAYSTRWHVIRAAILDPPSWISPFS